MMKHPGPVIFQAFKIALADEAIEIAKNEGPVTPEHFVARYMMRREDAAALLNGLSEDGPLERHPREGAPELYEYTLSPNFFC